MLDETYALSQIFFRSPDDVKDKVAVSGGHRGWLRIGEARMEGSERFDLKESFIWGLDVPPEDPDVIAGDRLLAVNRWPATPSRMRDVFNRYFTEMQRCGEQLLRAFALSLDIAPDYFIRHMDRPVSRAAAVWYPPQAPDLGDQQFGVSPHTDYGTLTLVQQDAVGGLQVRSRDGDWVTAPPIEDALVVNVGDLLARWTNDRFVSTLHRVMVPPGDAVGETRRLSIGFFVGPRYNATVECLPTCCGPDDPPKYAPVVVDDYRTARFAAGAGDNSPFRAR
jgi:isopenicillin N synthase-like dioxygenase